MVCRFRVYYVDISLEVLSCQASNPPQVVEAKQILMEVKIMISKEKMDLLPLQSVLDLLPL